LIAFDLEKGQPQLLNANCQTGLAKSLRIMNCQNRRERTENNLMAEIRHNESRTFKYVQVASAVNDLKFTPSAFRILL